MPRSLQPPAPSESSYLEPDDLGGHTVMAEMPVTLIRPPKRKQQTPQAAIDEFWSKFTTKAPGKATTVIPQNEYAEKAARRSTKAVGTTTQASYEEAAAVCAAKVAKIVKECRRVNQKYRDPHFDLEFDLKWGSRDTLQTLCNARSPKAPAASTAKFKPKSVKRVIDIFDAPKFYIDGPTANDVRQGRDGDCWLLAALCTLSNKLSLIERVCVARDEQVGVYGFVFHRDGEWISEIIDDKLFLTKPDFDESYLERMLWEDRERINSEEQYRQAYQSGSGALYFAQCEHANETWLPLLEKAYAKAHGDYAAIEGGFTGEGIEDLTGGVTTELYATDILDKEYFWKEELMKVNDEFLFGCSTGMWGIGWGDRKGIVELHAYSVMRAIEMDGQRLVLLKNPWGKGEWKGAWSDGSKEWTAEWLVKLNHRFGDDGNFWISYDDLLRKYQAFDRTRLFGPEWKVTSLWTTLSVPWTLDYHDTYFTFSLAKTGPVVLVLSQLDDRYYRGLEGQYRFELNFRLHRNGQEDYVVRSINPYCQNRSVNVELELEEGEYTVLLKVNATRDLDILPIEEVIRNHARDRRDKLIAVGMSYDLAHSKGVVIESPEEKKAKRDAEKRRKDKERADLRKKIMDGRRTTHYLDVKDQTKRLEKRAKAKAKAKAKKAAKAGKAKAAKEAKQKSTVAAAAQNEPPLLEAAKEKHVKILPPSPTPGPDDSKKDLVSDSSSTEQSVKTPPTESEKSAEEASPTSREQQLPSSETASDGMSSTDAVAGSSTGSASAALSALLSAASAIAKKLEEARSESDTVGDAAGTSDNKDYTDIRSSVVVPSAESPKGGKAQIRQGGAEDEDKDKDKDDDDDDDTDGEDKDTDDDDDDEDTSDAESDISSISEISSRALDLELERRAAAPCPPPPPVPKEPPEEEDEFESNPWNAVATVGLRVYYRVPEEDKIRDIVKLRVVRPNPYAAAKKTTEQDKDADGHGDEKDSGEGEGDDDGVPKSSTSKGLDVDDSSKDATLEGDQEQRKKSILSLLPAE
ncbi:Uu.00g103710.m01.CDS01 [Anthostomella pinea]|uniref:Uu.00g103710.m01.CDS01 n=1 Tax=Anthostomella pinea TaxID=933095 RepID=A0AAI8VEK3_9PEZI|nr:Uu.00g103710.m01.CDS01 [Anthostomella pinea]